MQIILITGATGLLGSSLTPYLRKCGYHVVTHANTTLADVMFDITDRGKSYSVFERVRPDVIINLVSLTSVELCEKEIREAYLLNTRSVENIVHWIESEKSDCHLLQISTDQVYDGVGFHMEENITITNNYAMTKYAGELAAIRIPSTILRTNFVGRSKVSHRESLTDWVYNSIMNKKPVQVLDDIFFSPLSISVLIEMIELAVQKRRVGIFNLGSRNGMSKADFDFAFAESLNLSTNTMTRIRTSHATFLKAYRPKNMCMDNSRFEEAFGVILPSLADLIEPLAQEYYEVI
jgi:dTDP-4-dehydrorhamnose reductase